MDYAQDRLLLEDNIGEMLWMTCVSLTDRFARDKRNEEIKEAKSKVRNIYYLDTAMVTRISSCSPKQSSY